MRFANKVISGHQYTKTRHFLPDRLFSIPPPFLQTAYICVQLHSCIPASHYFICREVAASIQELERSISFICYLTLEDLEYKIGGNPNKTYLIDKFCWMTLVLPCLAVGQQPLGHSLALMEHLLRSTVDMGQHLLAAWQNRCFLAESRDFHSMAVDPE